MLNLNFDLTGLEKAGQGEASGKPIEFAIEDVIEDPDQPRDYFDEDELEQLANNIKQKGVKTPISVKPKNADGKYVINFGARRYRASIMAGRTTIPGFIDETHDKYDQVNENLLREGLTPMALALFIRERVQAGDSKKIIAENLGQKSQSFISELLPLIEAPSFIQTLARTKKHSGKTLYVLCKAWEKMPMEIEAYVASTEEITRPGIQAVLAGMKAPEPDLAGPSASLEPSPHVEQPVEANQPGVGIPVALANDVPAPQPASLPSPAVEQAGASDTKMTSAKPAKPAKPVSDVTSPPLSIAVRVNGQIARLNQAGKVTVTFEATGETQELDFATIEIIGTKSV